MHERDGRRDYSACFGATRRQRFACGVCIGLATIAAVAVIVVLVLAYGRTARPPSFDVSDASLTRFALSTTVGGPTNISYSLTLTLTVRNPNRAMDATIRSLEADYLFDGQRFGRVQVPDAQGSVVRAGETAVFPVVAGAEGDHVMDLMNGNGSVEAYRNQSKAGVFHVLVGFCGQVTFKPHAMWCRLEVSCGPLRLKLPAHEDDDDDDGAAADDVDDRNATAAVRNAPTCKVLSPQGGC